MSCEINKQERRTKGKIMLCETVAHKIKYTIMKDIKAAESDIASACVTFHKRHEQKTGKPITTINEFELVTRQFSQLPKSEIEELIKEGKEEDRKSNETLKEIMRRNKQVI